jgi:acylphosphatase
MALRRVHLHIHGLVQGVGFRFTTQREASRLELAGWVRNRPDGAVEVVAEGEETVLRELVAWCHHGPLGAEVSRVEVEWSAPAGEPGRFGVRH